MRMKLTDVKCGNCKYYVKYKQYCNKHKMNTKIFSMCLQFEKKEDNK